MLCTEGEIQETNICKNIVIALLALALCACGSIKSNRILGVPLNPPSAYVLEELKAGEFPDFGTTISRGSIDTITNAWLNLRVGSDPRLRVNWNEMDCTQISSANRACCYSLQGPAPAGSVVTGT